MIMTFLYNNIFYIFIISYFYKKLFKDMVKNISLVDSLDC